MTPEDRRNDRRAVLLRSVGVGLASGGRSTSGVAALASAGEHSASDLLTGTRAKRVTGLLLLGELIADKLPSTPSRLQPPVLAVRMAAGALSASSLCARSAVAPAGPVAVGAAAAAVGSVAGLRWRSWAQARGWADLPAALLEDAVVLLLARVSARP